MNELKVTLSDDIKAFQLLTEVGDEQQVSQRELAKRLGIAVGLVNSYLKNFVAKGYVRIKNYPHNRYGYLLTPAGIAEKARIAYQHVNYFTSLYTVTRQDYQILFKSMVDGGVVKVSFCGVDEVAEIAWLSLHETGLELDRVMDENRDGGQFMGRPIDLLTEQEFTGRERVVVTSLKRGSQLRELLIATGLDPESIFLPGSGRILSSDEDFKQ